MDFLPLFSFADFTKGIPYVETHIHTTFSDGNDTLENVVLSAIEKNIELIAFTEHTEAHYHKNDQSWFQIYLDQLELAKSKHGQKIKILSGIEAAVIDFDGTLDVSDEIIEQVDFVLGSVHRYPGLKMNQKVSNLDLKIMPTLEYKALKGLVKNKKIHSIAHIGATCSTYGTPLSDEQINEIIRLAGTNHIGIEINTKYHQPIKNILEACFQKNTPITIGSDCHSTADLGVCAKHIENYLKFNRVQQI